jgi:hypothetical protein
MRQEPFFFHSAYSYTDEYCRISCLDSSLLEGSLAMLEIVVALLKDGDDLGQVSP